MSLKVRRVVFYSLLLLFIVGGAAAIFYSQGYRLGKGTFGLQKIGGIFIKSIPSDVRIVIDGKEVQNKSSFLQSGTFISGLTPGKYFVEVSRENYQPWQKTLRVQPSLVEEASGILLVPQTIRFSEVESGVENFWVNNKSLVVKDEAQRLDLVGWASDRRSAIFFDSARNTYTLSKLPKSVSSLNLTLLFNNLKERKLGLLGAVPIAKMSPHPFSEENILVATKGALYGIDTAKSDINLIATGTISDFTATGDKVFWVGRGGVWSYNFVVRATTRLGGDGFTGKEIVAAPSGATIAVKGTDESLWVFTSGDTAPTKIANYGTSPVFSPDEKKLAFVDERGVTHIYFVEEFLGDVRKKKGETLDVDFRRGILADFQWHEDSLHFFAVVGNELIFSEIDDRKPTNTYVIKSGVSKYFYDRAPHALYALDGETLSQFNFKF